MYEHLEQKFFEVILSSVTMSAHRFSVRIFHVQVLIWFVIRVGGVVMWQPVFHFHRALDDAGTPDLFHGMSLSASLFLAVFIVRHW